MGCMKKNLYGRKAGEIKKALLVTLVGAMFVSAITPVVFGATSDYIIVNFTPSGAIDISVNQTEVNFSATAGTSGNYPTECPDNNDIAVFNDGQVDADISIDSNITTNSSGDREWTLDEDGTPGEDHHSFRLVNNSGAAQTFVPNSDNTAVWFTELNAGGGTNLFGVMLDLGNASSSTKLDAQLTWINFTGVAS